MIILKKGKNNKKTIIDDDEDDIKIRLRESGYIKQNIGSKILIKKIKNKI